MDDPARMRMGEFRALELAAAADELGLQEVMLLDHRNGFLPYEAGYDQRMRLAQPVVGTV